MSVQIIMTVPYILPHQTKLKAKTGGLKYQWQIMQSLGMQDEEIKAFADPHHWLYYFPPHCKADMQRMGVKVGLKHKWLI